MAVDTRNVIYCPICGHSSFRGTIIAVGSDICREAVVLLDIDDWKKIARKPKTTALSEV